MRGKAARAFGVCNVYVFIYLCISDLLRSLISDQSLQLPFETQRSCISY